MQCVLCEAGITAACCRYDWSLCYVLLVSRLTSFNEGSIRNQFACHVLVHVINIKPSSTPQSLISPGLYTHTVSPTLSPLFPSLTHSLSVSLLSPFALLYLSSLLSSLMAGM